jgi:hypothetical protein
MARPVTLAKMLRACLVAPTKKRQSRACGIYYLAARLCPAARSIRIATQHWEFICVK